jgi:hypothetical protein
MAAPGGGFCFVVGGGVCANADAENFRVNARERRTRGECLGDKYGNRGTRVERAGAGIDSAHRQKHAQKHFDKPAEFISCSGCRSNS